MNGNGGWFRRLGSQMKSGIRKFMQGRYGTDELNPVILWIGVIFVVLSILAPVLWLNRLLLVLSYACMGFAIFRSLSRNTARRYRENRRYLNLIGRVKDREHRYFRCPKCRQNVRVPKGKGKISITCPRCHEKFVRKT